MSPENFDKLYDEHYAEIFRHCQRIVRSRQDAEELAARTFIKAYKNLTNFDCQKSSLRSWIFLIASRLCFDFLGSKSHRYQQQTQSLDESIIVKNSNSQPDTYSEHNQLVKFIEDCLAELGVEERTAVSLRHLQGFTLQEIAQILGMNSPNSAKSRLKSGEKKLKECLEKKGIDDQFLQVS